MSVVSSIYQLRTAPKSVISLPLKRPGWSSKILRSVDASRHHAAAPYSPWLDSGLSVLTKVPHQCSNSFNRVGIRRTVPSQFVATSKRVSPRSGLGSMKLPKQVHNIKPSKASNWKHDDELALRYTSLAVIIPNRVANSVIGGSGTDCLTLVREMSR